MNRREQIKYGTGRASSLLDKKYKYCSGGLYESISEGNWLERSFDCIVSPRITAVP